MIYQPSSSKATQVGRRGTEIGERLHSESKDRLNRRLERQMALLSQVKLKSQSFRVSAGSHQYLTYRKASKSPTSCNNGDELPVDDRLDFNNAIASPFASTRASTDVSPIATCIRYTSPFPTPSPRPRRQPIPWSSMFSEIISEVC
jgi:hypothetical protein